MARSVGALVGPLLGAILALPGGGALRAQAPPAITLRPAPPGQPAPGPKEGPATEALRRVIREELKAEMEKKAEQEQKKKDEQERKNKEDEERKKLEPEWFEVGKDLQLDTAWSTGFVAETRDKAFRIHLGGRTEFDNAWFTQDDNLLLGSSPSVRLRDGSLFRRARLRADGTLWELIDFATEVNFANIQDVSNVDNALVQVGSVGLTHFWLTFREVPVLGNVRVGHQKAPVGLERSSSANTLNYMERSSLFDAFLGPNQFQNGVVAFDSYFDDRVTLAGALTRVGKTTVQSFGFDAEDGVYAASGRATALPVYEDEGRMLMHVGAGFQHKALVGNQFNVASRPLLRAGSGRNDDTPNLVFTGTFFTPNGATIVGLEHAMVCGPFSLSAEYALARVTDVFERFNGLAFSDPRGDVTYHAFYVEGGLFVTPGDHRRYDKQTATWDRTVPEENAFAARTDGGWCCGRGAVELVARYTYLDLVDGDPVLTPTSGGARAGRQHDVTLGVNWYLNPQVWIMVNYVRTHVDSVVAGASGDLQGIGCRAHVDF